MLPINIPILRYERDRKMYIKELNEWLMEMAKMNNLIFVNYYATMTFPGTDKLLDGITYDGLHPNAKGSSIEEHTKIVFAKHQNDAGMLGAFYHFCSLH